MAEIPPPHYVITLEQIFWGAILLATTVVLHGSGMVAVVLTSRRLKDRLGSSASFATGMCVLVLAGWLIALVHMLEVMTWGLFFFWKGAVNNPQITGIAGASLAYYVALMDYTTLGCDYDLYVHWRLLEGMIAIAGLLTFAWSTGVMMTMAQEFQDRELTVLWQRHKRK